ncbi:MAG: 30S ribosomal protein S6 [Thermodesulfobacteriota bacterium]
MRRYETIVIADPDLSEDQRVPLFDRMTEIIDQEGGFLIETDEWGGRKLAYEIKGKPRGYYVRLEYCGTGPVVDELERFYRIDDRVLKFMTILLEKDADVEAVKARMAEAEAAETRAAEEADSEAAAESTEETVAEPAGEPESAPASSATDTDTDTETAPTEETAETKEEV